MAQNYITKLQNENRELKAAMDRQQKAIGEFRAFLASPKFWNDTTIQVRDVEARLMEMWRLSIEGEAE